MLKRMIFAMLAVVAVVCSTQAGTVFMAYTNSSYGTGSNWWPDGVLPTATQTAEIRSSAIVDTQVAAPMAIWMGINQVASLTISGSGGFNTAVGSDYSYVGNGYDGTINLENSSTLTMGPLFLGNYNNPGGTGTLNVTGGGTLITSSLLVGWSALGVANIVNGTVQTYDLNIGTYSVNNKIFIGEFGTLKFAYNSGGTYPSDLQSAFDDFVADGRLYTTPGRKLVLNGGTITSVPKGDLSCDCKINLIDFSILAEQWLTVGSGCPGDACADLVEDGKVDFKDVGTLAENWLDTLNPCTPILNFTWTAGDDISAPVFDSYDLAAGIAWDGDGVYTFDPRPYQNLKVYKGTTVDNLTYQYNGALDSSFNHPYGDDAYWLGGGLWVDPATGYWYTLCEIEFNYYPSVGQNPYGRTGLATSTDKGHTWHYEGDILTGDNPRDRKYFASNWRDVGDTLANFFVNENDGYIYAVIGHCWQLSTGGDDTGTRIARSPITSKMAPGSWTKWYNGSWSEPGLGGHSSDILTNVGVTYIGYNTYLEKYIAMGSRWLDGVGMISEISVCDSMETQNWAPAQRFLEQDLTEYSARLLWYHWAWDPATNSRNRLGQTFRLYTTQGGYNGVGAKYIPITLGAGTTHGLGFPSFYPLVSVPDYTPEYDQDTDLYLPTTLRSDFSGGSSAGWATGIGGGWSVTGFVTPGFAIQELSVPANTSVINTAAPSCTSGKIWFTTQSDDAARKFTAYFRYVNSGSYAAITYDNGVIGWKTASASGSLVTLATPFDTGSTHSFKISFDASNLVKIYIDSAAAPAYSGTVSGLPVQSGTWGLGSGASATNLFDNAAIAPLP